MPRLLPLPRIRARPGASSRPSGGRVLLVTGASSGIGRAVALRAARRGDHVVLVARDAATLDTVAEECRRAGAASATIAPADVGHDDQVRDAFARALERHGRVDGVASVAAVVTYGSFHEVPSEVFDGVVRTNLLGSANVARQALAVMRRQEHGSLVLVGSLVGHMAVPGLTPYVVSKWGVRALARHLQIENRDLAGVGISYVAPGPVLTPIWEQAGSYTGHAGLPPPPADSPDKVARVVLERIDEPRNRTQVGVANVLARVAFSAAPPVYDALVAPVLRMAMTDFTRPVQPHAGNVLEPRPHLDAVAADYPGAARRLARGLGARARAALVGSKG